MVFTRVSRSVGSGRVRNVFLEGLCVKQAMNSSSISGCGRYKRTSTAPSQQRCHFLHVSTASLLPSSSTSSTHPTTTLAPAPKRSGRWLTDMKARLGKCIFHGLLPTETKELAGMMDNLTRNWREYVAGSEGFLTSEDRRGLFRHAVVWGDMDSMAHVNNIAYTGYAEGGRIQWALNFSRYIDPAHSKEWQELWTPSGQRGFILRSIKVDYKFPIKFPDKVSVYHKLNSVSDDAFTLDAIILSEKHQRPTARTHEDIVVYNYKSLSKCILPEFMKVQFEKTLDLQEGMRRRILQRMEEFEGRVGNFEREVMSRKEMK